MSLSSKRFNSDSDSTAPIDTEIEAEKKSEENVALT